MSSEEQKRRSERPIDVVVWGATGFTGKLVAEYLASCEGVRVAMAGRNLAKLEATRNDIAARVPAAASVPLLVGDANDPASLDAIVSQGSVVATTVGPFAKYGEPVVAACLRNGTDYCDITGETHFIRRIIDTYDKDAREKGTRIVPTCGFDSIPSDLGAFVLAEHARDQNGRALAEVRAYVTSMKGGMSGGTAASMIGFLDAAAEDPSLRRVLADPYSLSPDRDQDLGTDERDLIAPRWDEQAGGWAAPWVMAAINTRVVRRSNALFGFRYGKSFRYQEAMLFRGRAKGAIKAAAVSASMLAILATLGGSSSARRLAEKKLPASGEGPPRAAREAGYVKMRFYGVLEGDLRASLLLNVDVKGDPGYAATARMLGESALSLAHDPAQPGFEGGVLTPATAMGMRLVERLRRKDITFDVTSI